MSEDKDKFKQMTVHDLERAISVPPDYYARARAPNKTYDSIIAQAQIDMVKTNQSFAMGTTLPIWEKSEDPLEHLYQMKFRNRFERWIAKKLLKWKHGIEIK